jgi:hypothetical protein
MINVFDFNQIINPSVSLHKSAWELCLEVPEISSNRWRWSSLESGSAFEAWNSFFVLRHNLSLKFFWRIWQIIREFLEGAMSTFLWWISRFEWLIMEFILILNYNLFGCLLSWDWWVLLIHFSIRVEEVLSLCLL